MGRRGGAIREQAPRGRLTLVLYNSYDATRFREAHRRALARAGALCAAFDANLAVLGMPLPEGARTPTDVADAVTASTTIGNEGRYFRELAAAGRFQWFDFPKRGLPPQLGTPVLATSRPTTGRSMSLSEARSMLAHRKSVALIVGLGPHGVPDEIARMAPHHLDFTAGLGGPRAEGDAPEAGSADGSRGHGLSDGGFSLETATAMGAGLALLLAPDPPHPRLTVDGLVERDGSLLLVRRRQPPHAGRWALPGGFVDAGERAADAVVREVREEAGLDTQPVGLVGFYSHPRRDPRRHTASAAFALSETGPTRQPQGGDDAEAAAFFPLDALPPLAFDHGRIVADYVGWKQDGRARTD